MRAKKYSGGGWTVERGGSWTPNLSVADRCQVSICEVTLDVGIP
jgi:hypothetical protein